MFDLIQIPRGAGLQTRPSCIPIEGCIENNEVCLKLKFNKKRSVRFTLKNWASVPVKHVSIKICSHISLT